MFIEIIVYMFTTDETLEAKSFLVVCVVWFSKIKFKYERSLCDVLCVFCAEVSSRINKDDK